MNNNLIDVQQIKNVYNTEKQMMKLDSFEVMVLHITLSREKGVNDKYPVMFVLVTVYRPPGHHTDFIKELADFI